MRIRYLFIFIVFLASVGAHPQSRRAAPAGASASTEAVPLQSVKQLFEEANTYTKTKFAEFEKKKVPYSEHLRLLTKREQKQLAAKHAAAASTRENLTGEDFYYLGLLHWIAENLDGTAESLRKYLASEAPAAEKAPTSDCPPSRWSPASSCAPSIYV